MHTGDFFAYVLVVLNLTRLHLPKFKIDRSKLNEITLDIGSNFAANWRIKFH